MKLLILFPREIYMRRMALCRRWAVKQAVKDLGAHLSGVGWDDYDVNKTAQQNIDAIMPDADFVWWYKPLGFSKYGGIAPIKEPQNTTTPTFAVWNECWWADYKAEGEAKLTGDSLAVIRHVADVKQWLNLPIIHNVHCASSELFTPKPFKDRTVDLLIVGVQSKAIYPIRDKFYQLAQQGRLPGNVQVVRFPGYHMNSRAQVKAQEQQYAEAIRNAKLMVCDSSIYKYGLNKYTEAWMSGTAVIGDCPPDYATDDGLFVNKVELSDDLDTVERKTRAALSNMSRLELLGEASRDRALKNYDMKQWIANLKFHLERFKKTPWGSGIIEFSGRTR